MDGWASVREMYCGLIGQRTSSWCEIDFGLTLYFFHFLCSQPTIDRGVSCPSRRRQCLKTYCTGGTVDSSIPWSSAHSLSDSVRAIVRIVSRKSGKIGDKGPGLSPRCTLPIALCKEAGVVLNEPLKERQDASHSIRVLLTPSEMDSPGAPDFETVNRLSLEVHLEGGRGASVDTPPRVDQQSDATALYKQNQSGNCVLYTRKLRESRFV